MTRCLAVIVIVWTFQHNAYGSWYMDVSTACEGVISNFVPDPATFNFANSSENRINGDYSYSCNNGYLDVIHNVWKKRCYAIWNLNLNTVDDAKWVGSNPQCIPFVCAAPDRHFGSIEGYSCNASLLRNEYGEEIGYPVYAKCTFSCSSTEFKPVSIHCTPNSDYETPLVIPDENYDKGRWVTSGKRCSWSQCDPYILRLISHCSHASDVGSKCHSYCNDEDKRLIMPLHEVFSCKLYGDGSANWEPAVTSCRDIEAPDNCGPYTGRIEYLKCTDYYYVGSICEAICQSTQQIEGSKFIECMKMYNGSVMWNAIAVGYSDDEFPQCEDLLCPEPPDLPGADLLTCSDGRRLQSICTYKCPDMATGAITMTCRNDPDAGLSHKAFFTYDGHTCIPTICPDLDKSSLSSETTISCTNKFNAGSNCVFSCPAGMGLDTPHDVMKCTDSDSDGNGEWNVIKIPNCKEMMCSELTNSSVPDHLSVSCSNKNNFGSVCGLSCKEGYKIDGSVTDTECLDSDNDGNAEWSSIPICERIRCMPEYSFMYKGNVTCTDSNYYNSICNYSCEYSHRLVGAEPAACLDPDGDGIGEWNESMPICEKYDIPDPFDCPEHPEPAQGSTSCTDGGYFGSVCSFYCDKGFVLFGTNELECREKGDGTGEWTDIFPICLTYLGECMEAMYNPDHGNVTCTGKHYVNSECTYLCDDGYHVAGNKVIRCEDNNFDRIGEWSARPPICFPDVVVCEPPHTTPVNSTLTCTNNNIKNSICTFSCDNGYYVDGSPTSQCNDADNDGIGSWSSSIPACRMITCDFVAISDLSQETQYNCTNENYGNSECTFLCLGNFRLDGNPNIKCLDVDDSSQGMWNYEIPNCLPVTCDFDSDALDSSTVYSCTDSNHLDSVCEFSCPLGMKMTTEQNIITCEDGDGDEVGNWSYMVPDCTTILCDELVMEADTRHSCTSLNHFASVCEFQCDVGMRLDSGVNEIVCQDLDGDGTGNWTDTAPDCIYIVCPVIHQKDLASQTVFSCSNANLGNSICSFSCPAHMRFIGDVDSVTCVDRNQDGDGEWSDEVPNCIDTCSPPLVAPSHGTYECTDENRKGSECAFRCDIGYVLSHINVVVCGMNVGNTFGEWKGREPKCEPYKFVCPLLSSYDLSLETEVVCTNDNDRGSRCTFSCPQNLELRPAIKTIDCVDRNRDGVGEWSADPPQCRRKSCSGVNTEIVNGKVSCTSFTDIGSECSYECNVGFHLDQPHATLCQEDGFWNESVPTCKPDKCYPDLRDMFTTDADCFGGNDPGAECDIKCSHTSPKYGEKVKYVCANKYVRNGAGFWDYDILSCAGCGSGLLDIMFILDGSVNLPVWDFADVKDWIPHVLYKIRKVINYGALWLSVAVLGSRETKCNQIYSIPDFKVEMKFRYRSLEHIRRDVRDVRQIGGCAHAGHGLTESFNYFENSKRPFVTGILVLVLGGGSYDSASAVLSRINNSDIAIMGVGRGYNAKKFFQSFGIPFYYITHPEDYEYISQEFLRKIVKYDCREHSQCSGPIAHGSAICKLMGEKGSKEVCSIICDRNYLLVGPEIANCGDLNNDGKMEWLSPHGTCELITCPNLEAPDGLKMKCTNENLYASVCQFSCKNGYHMIGISELYCGDPGRLGVGKWNANVPECIPLLECLPLLSAPEFGTVVCTKKNDVGSQCTFHCDTGLKLVGSGDILCQDSGQAGQVAWSSLPPVCEDCRGGYCEKDIVVLLDSSRSVSDSDLKQVRESVIAILEGFQGEIDTGLTQIGLIQYSGKSTFLCASGVTLEYKVELELGHYPFRLVRQTVAALPRLGRCTATGQAISLVTKHFQTLGRGSAHWVMLIITDGRSNDDVTGPSQRAKAAGITVVPIGIGTFNPDQLLAISERIFTASGYDKLPKVVKDVQFEIMSIEDDSLNSALIEAYNPLHLILFLLMHVWIHLC